MQFYNKQVASEVRELANEQLKEYIAAIIQTTINNAEYAQETGINLNDDYIKTNLNNMAYDRLPSMVNVLLNKDGIIFPRESPEDVFSIWLSYGFIGEGSTEKETAHLDSFPKFLVGGLTTGGTIHT